VGTDPRPLGKPRIQTDLDGAQLRLFTKSLLKDVAALEALLKTDLVERGIRKIGAEQELFLVDHAWRAAPVVTDVLEHLDRSHFTTELGRFNLECNLEPLVFGGDCLRRLEHQLDELLAQARRAANAVGAEIVMVGILPTLQKEDLTLDNMTPIPRYFALNDALNRLAGRAYEFEIQGVDELSVTHDSVMAEACNTSFQVHFQVAPEEFARLYNLAQAVSAPVLAASTNAPLLFGKRLWRETRIALFQQSIDTRSEMEHRREVPPRVSFGQRWVHDSVLEIYREDIARFKVLLGLEESAEDPFLAMAEGRAPRLTALSLHNGTVYRWNRVCYGCAEGRAHIRIEARFLPSGPSVLDEVANAAFWFGILSGMTAEVADIREHMDFEHAKANFFAAARLGLQAQFTWLDGRTVPAQRLIRQELLPLARHGLTIAGIDANDIERYLQVIEQRVASAQTGAQWMLRSLASFKDRGTRSERMSSLTAAAVARQKTGAPAHEWPLARLEEAGEWRENYYRVDQIMATDLITVDPDEPIDLVANLMDWQHLRHVLVEDSEHRLLGLVSTRSLLRYYASQPQEDDADPVPVREVMLTDVVTVSRDTETLDAIEIMARERLGCLPVVDGETLVGLVTENDFLSISKQLIEEKLRR
jgi:CBS domain-containing protein/gamma-glutamyl:cysteine ligase YbdK (ATP-grasp superfamily)